MKKIINAVVVLLTLSSFACGFEYDGCELHPKYAQDLLVEEMREFVPFIFSPNAGVLQEKVEWSVVDSQNIQLRFHGNELYKVSFPSPGSLGVELREENESKNYINGIVWAAFRVGGTK